MSRLLTRQASCFDNLVDPLPEENHLDRPEVAEALKNSSGESERFSTTLDEKTWYYALRLPDGNILRLALTADRARLGFRIYSGSNPLSDNLQPLGFSACPSSDQNWLPQSTTSI